MKCCKNMLFVRGFFFVFILICVNTSVQGQLTTEQQLQEKGFDATWINSLTDSGEARWYQGEELKHIGQAVGGLYAGQLYLGGDGRLWYWDIFNRRVFDPGGGGDKFYNKSMKPDDYRSVSSGFVLDLGDRVVPLDARGFKNCRFRGEYPIARVNLSDDQVPVSVSLESFSPFCPTDSQLSSMPATIMAYTLTNTSDQDIQLRVGGWLENAGNRKSITAGNQVPSSSEINGANAVLLSARSIQNNGKSRVPVPVADFENGYDGWKTTGTAFGNKPFDNSKSADWLNFENQKSRHLVNSHNTQIVKSSPAGDALTGSITSPKFKINRNFLTFQVAGGKHDERVTGGGLTAVEVWVGDEVVARQTGDNSARMKSVNVNLSDYQGKKAYLRLVDTHKGSWGFIAADDFVLSDTPIQKQIAGDSSDTGTMAIVLLGQKGNCLDANQLPEHWTTSLNAAEESVPQQSAVIQSDKITLPAGESREFRFAVCWHFPNGHLGTLFPGEITRRKQQRNYYSKTYDDAADVVLDLEKRHDDLTATTRKWRDTWYDSTLPVWFLDRTFLNASTLATTSAFRMHDPDRKDLDGRVYFWEGTYLGAGTCTHVTHYEQAFGRLFPDSARDQRRVTDFNAGWDDHLGYVKYRAEWGIGSHFGIPHAIDGHAGTILRTYREHTTSTDNDFLKSVWPRVKRAVQFMIDQDAGRGYFEKLVPAEARNQQPDGILEGPQYHTLDKYWKGVIPWTSGMYMGSLRAAEAMARDMGDDAFADQCRQIVKTGGAKLTKMTFRDDYGYFIQLVDRSENLININKGCHIDQCLGDYWTNQVGLEPVFPKLQTASALSSIFKNNLFHTADAYRGTAKIKVHRFYADSDEPGTFICTFPHGGARDSVPQKGSNWDGLVAGYFSECMTGFTYQAASHMIGTGHTLKGLALCRAIHDRYAEAPLRRNPFNEVEYGNHYTRAMSSYGAFIAASGFEYHGPQGRIGFAPKLNPENFRGAFTAAEGWGSYQQQLSDAGLSCQLTVKHGSLAINQFSVSLNGLDKDHRVANVEINGQPADRFEQDGDRVTIHFKKTLNLSADQSVKIDVR